MLINENIYDMSLISKIKEQSGTKKLKKITKNLRNLADDDVNKSSKLKIKIFEEKNEEEKKSEFKIATPIIGLQQYINESKKFNSNAILKIDNESEAENTPSTVDNNEEEKQIDSSDFSDDE